MCDRRRVAGLPPLPGAVLFVGQHGLFQVVPVIHQAADDQLFPGAEFSAANKSIQLLLVGAEIVNLITRWKQQTGGTKVLPLQTLTVTEKRGIIAPNHTMQQ